MIRLAWASIGARRTAFAGTFLAAVLTATLVGGAGLLLFSVLTATPSTHRFDAADVMIGGSRAISLRTVKHKGDKEKSKTKTERLTGAPVLPAGWPARIAQVPGVADSVADTSFMVRLATGAGRPVGDGRTVAHGWASAALTPFTLRAGRAPGEGQIAVDAGLAATARLQVGDTVRLVTRTGERKLPVSGIVAPAGDSRLAEQSSVFVADADVAAVAGMSGPTAIGVTARHGTEPATLARRISAALGVHTVYTGPAKVRADLPGALPDYIGAISIFGFVIGITVFAGVFVLTGTVGLSVRQRLRELAVLRATGATHRQVGRMLRAETLAVTAVAAVLAAPLEVLAAQVIAARFRALGVVPAEFVVHRNPVVVVAAGVLTAVVAYAGSRVASRRAVRIAPAQALTETAVEAEPARLVRTVIASVAAGGAVAVLTFVPLDGPFGMGMTFISSALLLCAVGAAGPLLVRVAGAAGARVAGLAGIAGWLAGALSRAENRRVTAVAVPLALMFAINAPLLLNGYLSADLAVRDQSLRLAAATATASGAVPLAAVDRLSGHDVAATIPTRLIIDEGGKPEDYPSQGLRELGHAPLDLGFVSGRWDSGGLSVSEYVARSRHWAVGRTVRLWLPDSTPVTMRVTGIYAHARGFGDLVVDAGLIARHDPRGLVTAIAVRGDPARVRAALPGARVEPTGPAPAGDADKQQGAWELMIAISLGFTAIAVVNTFAVAAAARRGQFAQLRLIGATNRQVRRMTTGETLLAVLIGLALGVGVTSIVVGAFSLAQDGGLRVFVRPLAYGSLLGLVGLLGLCAGVVPNRLVLRAVR